MDVTPSRIARRGTASVDGVRTNLGSALSGLPRVCVISSILVAGTERCPTPRAADRRGESFAASEFSVRPRRAPA